MIHNVTFMGREECLSRPAKQTVSKFHQYLSPSAIIEGKQCAQINTVKDTADETATRYFSEYLPEGKAVVNTSADEVATRYFSEYLPEEKAVVNTSADKISEAYRAAHGIMY